MSQPRGIRDFNPAIHPQLESLGQQLQDARIAMQQQQMALESFKISWVETEKSFNQKLQQTRNDLKDQEKNLKSSNERLAEMEKFYKVSLQKEGLTDMETFYKDKLQEARSALKEKKEELESFKDRLAGELALSIKTGKSESMNNPVSETKLKEMYEELKFEKWPKMKPCVKSQFEDSKVPKNWIQNCFAAAMSQIAQKIELTDKLFGLQNQRRALPQKVLD
ncbi:uncharacterized protein LOC115777792 [Archocentrus centrarchus]|uniref:uncharacterized protein LOC115777792 n=1 Tax=Archocentrus centrarchus TaxID=63155 RepID=UPI0011EA3FC7|nr:uncharacterized protein LOC115777792 [Archocentrus centrarchus]